MAVTISAPGVGEAERFSINGRGVELGLTVVAAEGQKAGHLSALNHTHMTAHNCAILYVGPDVWTYSAKGRIRVKQALSRSANRPRL